MNDDAFEKELRALGAALRPPDPTPAWRDDILARARREADAISPRRMLPPRWLTLTWAAAWAAILALHLTAPRETTSSVAGSGNAPKALAASVASPVGDSLTLLAFQERLRLNLDLP